MPVTKTSVVMTMTRLTCLKKTLDFSALISYVL